jgi:hypothetical protein
MTTPDLTNYDLERYCFKMQNSQQSSENSASTGKNWIKRYKWQGAIVLSLTIIALVVSFISPNMLASNSHASNAEAAGTAARSITIWSQALDSCRRAITGSTFNLTGPGVNVTQRDFQTGAALLNPLIIPQGSGVCPVQQGNCVSFAGVNLAPTCLQWHVTAPASGSATYTLKIVTPSPNHAGCVGGSVCPSASLQQINRSTGVGPQIFEFATITVNAAGSCSAKVTNYNPNWTTNKSSVRIFPNSVTQHKAATYACTQGDPVLFHESATHAAVSQSPNDCDGDNDADDHTTGAEGWSSLCDNDGDWNPNYRKGQQYTGGVSGAHS